MDFYKCSSQCQIGKERNTAENKHWIPPTAVVVMATVIGKHRKLMFFRSLVCAFYIFSDNRFFPNNRLAAKNTNIINTPVVVVAIYGGVTVLCFEDRKHMTDYLAILLPYTCI